MAVTSPDIPETVITSSINSLAAAPNCTLGSWFSNLIFCVESQSVQYKTHLVIIQKNQEIMKYIPIVGCDVVGTAVVGVGVVGLSVVGMAVVGCDVNGSFVGCDDGLSVVG